MGIERKILGLDLEPTEEEKERVKQLFLEKTQGKAKIILMSHTGSRAFGWSSKNYDFDIHGYFHYPKWFDYVHAGEEGYDLNMWSLGHLISMELQYKHGTTIANMGNPFYIDKDFPYDELLDLVTPDFFTLDEADTELYHFTQYNSPRQALHCYRAILVPLYFLRKRKFVLNIYKIADEMSLNLKGIYLCRDAYIGELKRNLTKDERDSIVFELTHLREVFKNELKSHVEQFDLQKYEKFCSKLREIYGEDL
jgi:hypothetical protein